MKKKTDPTPCDPEKIKLRKAAIAYVAAGGGHCMFCNGTRISTTDDEPQWEDGHVDVYLRCDTCHREWCDRYTLTNTMPL